MNKFLKISLILRILIKIALKYRNSKTIKIRRWWVKSHLGKHLQEKYSAHKHLFVYFSLHNHEEFYKFCRMSVEDFIKLYDLVHVKLQKKSRRKPIPPDVRLALVLNFLGHGGSIENQAWQFRVGLSTIYVLINEVCTVLSQVLIPTYVKFPKQLQWLQIAEHFNQKWNFPNCIGALDGTHISIQKPPHSGGLYKNYKKYYSLVLLALCDAQRRFLWFNFGDFGSNSDSSIFKTTDLFHKLENNIADIPPARPLPSSEIVTPFVIVADEIFGLSKNIMKPFSRRNNLTVEEKVFNYRLSRARLNIECAFGIMKERWHILHKPLAFKIKSIDKIICAIIGLHNFILYENDNTQCYIEEYCNHLDYDDQVNPIIIRETLKEYFSSPEGSVPWQYNMI